MATTTVLGNPIRVTGTATSSEKIADFDIPMLVGYIYWFNPTTAGHLCTLKTSDGSFIAELKCDTDGVPVHLGPLGIYVKNIYCDDMDSGTLYIYTK